MEKIKNETYVISVEDTKKYGIIQASIIGRIRFWCNYNEKKKIQDKFHDGEWWSGFMSSYDFEEQLGVCRKTIERNLSVLIKSGILIKGRFNKQKRDRTNWYRVNPFPTIEEPHFPLESKSISSDIVNPFPTIEEIHFPLDGKPLPVNHSVNHSVNQKLSNISGNPPVNPNWEKEHIIKVIEEIVIDDLLKSILINLISGVTLTRKQKDLIFENKPQLIEKIPALKEYI